MPTQLFDSYGRGILQRTHPRRVPPAYVRQALNVAWHGGQRRQRAGVRPFQGTPCIGNIRAMGMHVAADGQRQFLLIIEGFSNLFLLTAYGEPASLSMLGLPTGLQTRSLVTSARFISLSGGANLTFIVDGANTNLKWDGTQLTKMGLSAAPPPRTPTVIGIGGEISDGRRKYVATLDSGFHESNPTPFISALEVIFAGGTSTQSATFAGLVNGVDFNDPQALTWKLWRTVDDGEDYFLVGEAAIGGTITDTLADDVLTAGRPLVEFVGAEPAAPFVTLAEHRGQLLGVDIIDRNVLRHSYFDPEYMAPEGWPKNWATPIAHGDGDKITAIASFHEYAIVWKEFSTWSIVGVWPDIEPHPIYVAGTRDSIGCAGQGAVRQTENMILFRSRDGLYGLARESGADAGVAVKRLSNSVDDLWSGLDFSEPGTSLYDRNRRTVVFLAKGRPA